MINPIRTYDYLCLARGRLLGWVRPLSAEQYAQAFPIGPGSLARTLTHIMICEWYYVRRIERLPVPPYDQWPIQDEHPPAFADLEARWTAQAATTREMIAATEDWGTTLEYPITEDDGRAVIVTASAGDIFTQLVLHEVHHRAQAMNMLRHLGIASQDLDFNTLMYNRSAATG